MTPEQMQARAEAAFPMPERWVEPDAGTIHVPDELDKLINTVGFQYRLHTISKRFGEAEFICRAVYACQQYFLEKERAAFVKGMQEMEGVVKGLEEISKHMYELICLDNPCLLTDEWHNVIKSTIFTNQPEGAKEGE